MSEKQTNYIRTQIRLSPLQYGHVQEHAAKYNCSMNHAMTELIARGWNRLDDLTESDSSRGEAYAAIAGNLHYLDIEQLQALSSVVSLFLRGKPLIPKGEPAVDW